MRTCAGGCEIWRRRYGFDGGRGVDGRVTASYRGDDAKGFKLV